MNHSEFRDMQVQFMEDLVAELREIRVLLQSMVGEPALDESVPVIASPVEETERVEPVKVERDKAAQKKPAKK